MEEQLTTFTDKLTLKQKILNLIEQELGMRPTSLEMDFSFRVEYGVVPTHMRSSQQFYTTSEVTLSPTLSEEGINILSSEESNNVLDKFGNEVVFKKYEGSASIKESDIIKNPKNKKCGSKKKTAVSKPQTQEATKKSSLEKHYTTSYEDMREIKRWLSVFIRTDEKYGLGDEYYILNKFQTDAINKVSKIQYNNMSDGEKIQMLNILKDVRKTLAEDPVKRRNVTKVRRGK